MSKEHSGEERRYDTDDEGYGEAFYRTCTKHGQHDTCQERRYVCIDNSGDGALITVGDGCTQALTEFLLLTDSLEHKHVSIHCHTHRQHDTGDTRQGQHRSERSEDTEQQNNVAYQRCIGDETGDETVVENHIEEDKAEGYYKRNQTCANRLLTERRTYDILLDNASRRRHLT